eukprot:221475-Chlamydomonas_euryale.AAC.12
MPLALQAALVKKFSASALVELRRTKEPTVQGTPESPGRPAPSCRRGTSSGHLPARPQLRCFATLRTACTEGAFCSRAQSTCLHAT